MSKKQWLVLLMLFLTYLLLGATAFYYIERPLEAAKLNATAQERVEIYGLLDKYYKTDSDQNHSVILDKLNKFCGTNVTNSNKTSSDEYKWDFYNSFYFAYTVVSTIGYGNLAPTSMRGRILMIFYALIGIPMNGILLTQLGEFFSHVFVRAYKKYKAYKEGHSDSPKRLNPLETRRAGLAVQIFMYLTPGFIMFIFFPAFLFSYFENWTYDEAVYYAFVTLTTIGFGDYVAGQDNSRGVGKWFWWIIYKIFLIFWISFGLGYLAMIMSFITRGMRSKRITRLEHKLAANLKYTQTKILHEFNKDLNYLRRVFNEVYLMKLKPVYRDEYDSEVPLHKFPRSYSFPDLRELIYGGRESEAPIHPRRRANSEVAPMIQYEAINRVVSETDLQRIDKRATFASRALVQPGELLAHLVNAMGYIPPAFDDSERPEEEDEEGEFEQTKSKGIDGFSDKDILASEKPWAGSGWKIGDEKMPAPRMRAASEIGLTKDQNGFGNHQNSEWTWSGPAASKKIQELFKARKDSTSNQSKESKSRLPSFSFASVPKNIRPRWFNPFSSKKNSGEMSRRDSLPVDDIETTLRENYLSHTTNTRPLRDLDRRRSAAPHYFTHTGGNLPNTPEGNLLEETSLADFLRALTALHSRVGAVPEDLINRPQRKMGTASLTPPKLPSLLALFSPPPGFNSPSQSNQSTVTAASRRFSLRPVDGSGNSTPSYERRGSLISGSAPRRFSMQPEDTSGTSSPAYRRRGSLIPNARPRRFSSRNILSTERTSPQNSPPYTADMVPLHVHERRNPPPYSADPFIFECPKEPLVSAEVGPAQDGISLPVRGTPVPRRFSLRPAQIGVPPAPPLPKAAPTSRPVPRWKGGMLQRQIGELSLQRRVRAFSLGDVHSIRNDRTIGPTSPLALPNATSHLSTIFANRSTSGTENTDKTGSQTQEKTATVIPSGILSSRTTNDARQTSGSIDQTSVGQSSNGKMQMSRPQPSINDTLRTGLANPEQGAVDLTHFVKDERGPDKTKTTTVHKQTSNPFNPDILVKQSQESSASSQPSKAYEAVYTARGSGQLLTATKIDDRKVGIKPFTTNPPSDSSKLESVVVDKPLGKTDHSYSEIKQDLLSEVKVDSVKAVEARKRSGGESAGQLSTSDLDTSGRKISMISQKSSESVRALSDGERPAGRKISAMSQQSIELGSISGGRKSSSSKLDKPRISIESYRPLTEVKIEKPATNPFEQYKATVEHRLNKPREKSPESREKSTEMKGDVLRHRHSTSVASSASVSEAPTDPSAKHKDPKV